jgi:hypothetical protein
VKVDIDVDVDVDFELPVTPHIDLHLLSSPLAYHPLSFNMPKASSSKAGSSSKAAGSQQKSWARRYKQQLVDQKQQWLNTVEKNEEDLVISTTLAAIDKARVENKDEIPLPDNMSEVSI